MKWKIKKFKDLNTEELYEILKARYEVFTVGQQCLYQDCDNRDQKSYHMYLEEENRVVAYLRIVDKGIAYDEVSIGRVMVVESHRNKGLANQMMRAAIDFIVNELKEKTIKISAQEYLVDFYKNLGFEQISETYLEVKIPHVKMIYKA